MKYLKKIYENSDISVKIAVYNADKKELAAIFDNMALAAKYIYGDSIDYKAPDKIRQKLRSKNLIGTEKSAREFNIAVRNISIKQTEILGKNKWVFMPGYELPWRHNDSKL
jgi:hypothetical protein